MPTKQPPVFFTIAAIKHEPLALLSTFMPAIQDDLRKVGYGGRFVDAEITAQQDGVGTRKERLFQVFTPDQMSAFSFNDSGFFAYHTTAYTNRKALFQQFRIGLDVLHSRANLKTLMRVGVRMLDLLRPSDHDRNFADYLVSSLHGFRGIDCTNSWVEGIGSLEQKFGDGNAEITARFQHLPSGLGFPAELYPTIQFHAFQPHVIERPNAAHGILDIDCGSTLAQVFDAELAMKELARHKDRISMVFKKSVTDVALLDWGLTR